MNHHQPQQEAKMSASEQGMGLFAGRQKKLESMIRDPRSPINVESLLVSPADDGGGEGVWSWGGGGFPEPNPKHLYSEASPTVFSRAYSQERANRDCSLPWERRRRQFGLEDLVLG